jgi:hypothetical protein
MEAPLNQSYQSAHRGLREDEMRAILRVCGLIAAATMLMGTATCDLNDTGGGYTQWPRSSGPANPVPPPGRWSAVVWYSPSTYYNTAYNSRSCKAGYSAISYAGRPYCMACSPGTTLVFAGGNYACAKCPPGYAYYIYQGKPYCKTPA